jgi:hypothetical protein
MSSGADQVQARIDFMPSRRPWVHRVRTRQPGVRGVSEELDRHENKESIRAGSQGRRAVMRTVWRYRPVGKQATIVAACTH